MAIWIRQRLKQNDARISLHFLAISASSAKVGFGERDPEIEADIGSNTLAIRFPSISTLVCRRRTELAISCSPRASVAGLPGEKDQTE
ncbi:MULTISPECIES: hypothetical protein [unclassified Mesorhizobium]|uniref:hypothetical protein n=1 Tax=unclassified Mesorhizobium TaxID=325217 RepID=UPI000BCD48F2|nr:MULTISPECIES: hypothetical protein [unclassified Mesorhizobium]PBB83976.1 hypothetical protein CK216_25970 [Mesorhizobium sp. WSM3876]RWE20428.1 MAG: hypothetical protein EOS41_28620 [Mesorhizobium sp.]TGT57558.1 hypothetical protein EN813_036595 [Mesorhizobium sp. M00.F.Ca.ET.170.01.1.1]